MGTEVFRLHSTRKISAPKLYTVCTCQKMETLVDYESLEYFSLVWLPVYNESIPPNKNIYRRLLYLQHERQSAF